MRLQILRLGKNSVIYGVGTMIQRFAGLLFLPLFTAYLRPADFGVLAILALVGQVAQPVFALGLGAGMGPCYFEGGNEEAKAATVWTSFLLLLLSSAILAFIAWVCAGTLSGLVLQSKDHALLVALSLTGVALNNLATPFALRLQFESRAVPFIVISGISTGTTILSSVVLAIILRMGVTGMVWGQLLGYGAGTIAFLTYTYNWTKFSFRGDLVSELLSLGIPLVPAFALLLIIMHGNKYILQRIAGLDAVGIYSIGFNLGMAISIVVGAFQTAWYSYFMAFINRQEEAKALFARILTYYLLGVGAVALLMFAAARPVVMLLTPAPFHDAYRVVGLVATAQFLSGVFSLLLPGLYFAKRVVYVTAVQFGAAIALIGLSFSLIPVLGAFGAGLALMLAVLVMVLLLAGLIERNRNIYLRMSYELDRIGTFSMVFVLLAILLLLPYPFVWWQQAIILPIAGLTILGSMFALLRSSERHLFLKLASNARRSIIPFRRDDS